MDAHALSRLEHRLRTIEDKLAIYELIASHPPSADTGAADYTMSVYCEDGVFDRGPTLDGATGAADIAAFIRRPEHREAIRGGLAHVAGLPLIDLRGDIAVVTSYLMIVHLDHDGEPRVLPNHGESTGYRIHRTVVNRWELERRDDRWMIRRRTLLPVNGSDAHQELLRNGLNDLHGRNADHRGETTGGNDDPSHGPPARRLVQADTGGKGDRRAGKVKSMLSDGEALDGIEAWLRQQPLSFSLSTRGAARAPATYVESPAGWLLRLVRHARTALVG